MTVIETNHTAAEPAGPRLAARAARLGPAKICRSKQRNVMHNELPTRSAWTGRLDHRGGRIGVQ
jgi:hypothetical protein